MKSLILSLIAVIFLFASCEVKSSEPVQVAEGSLPLGSVQEPFEDNPDLIHVKVINTLGLLTARGNYFKGLRHGTWTEFYENGIPSSITNYDLGVIEGMSLIFDNTGQITGSTLYHSNMKHGESFEYLRSQVKTEMNYQNDKLEGLVKAYYERGGIQEEANYSNGKRNGVSRWYDIEGNLTIEYEYRDGELIQ